MIVLNRLLATFTVSVLTFTLSAQNVVDLAIARAEGPGLLDIDPGSFSFDNKSGFDYPTRTFTEWTLDPFQYIDIEFAVVRRQENTSGPIDGPEMLAFDKQVYNRSTLPYLDFHMEIGTGFGDDFVLSNDSDGLFFKHDPIPRDVNQWFNELQFDEPIDPDVLWFFPGERPDATGGGLVPSPGLLPQVDATGPSSIFWVGLQVPDNLFLVPTIEDLTELGISLDNYLPSVHEVAFFTVRQVPTPEPATNAAIVILGVAGFALWRRFRK